MSNPTKWCFWIFLLYVHPLMGQEGYVLGWELETEKTVNWETFNSEEARVKGLDSLKQQFALSGFLGSSWEKVDDQNDSLRVRFYLGPKVETLQLKNGNLPSGLISQSEWGVLSLDKYNLLVKDILTKLENTGHPFASIRMDSVRLDSGRLSGKLMLDQGPLILWDSIGINSSSKTNPKYLQRLSGIEVGDVFSQRQLDESALRLSRSPYFELQGKPQAIFRLQKAQPTFLLRERNANVIDGIIGLLPNENDPGKVLVTGQLDLRLYHLGGRGRDVILKWQRFNEQTQSLDLGVKESFIFNSGIDLSGEFSLLKQDTSFIKRELGLNVGFRANQNFYLTFFTKRQASDLLASSGFQGLDRLPDFADFRWNEYGIKLEGDWLDQPIFPRRGFRFGLDFATGNKRILQNTALPEELYEGLNLNTPQYALQLDMEKHFFVKSFWGMFFRSASGLIQNENLFLNDLYRIGGLQSIRGFNENNFFASTYSYLTMEQRLFFDRESYLLIFVDAGILENPNFGGRKDKPVAVGAGLNLDTGNGLFRFIYAVGKSNEQAFSLSLSKIHFGYLARF